MKQQMLLLEHPQRFQAASPTHQEPSALRLHTSCDVQSQVFADDGAAAQGPGLPDLLMAATTALRRDVSGFPCLHGLVQ